MDWMSSLPPQIRERFQGRPWWPSGGVDWRGLGERRREPFDIANLPPGLLNRVTIPPIGGEPRPYPVPAPGREGGEPWRGFQAPSTWADVARGRFAPMPQFLTPSAQYMNQMGPTAQQQYQGYAQATMGWLPEETMWRQRMMAPPAGQGINVNWR